MQQCLQLMEENSRRSEDTSAESCAALHRRMDEIVLHVGHLATGVSEMKEDVSEMKAGD